jgi:hypothetical protein
LRAWNEVEDIQLSSSAQASIKPKAQTSVNCFNSSVWFIGTTTITTTTTTTMVSNKPFFCTLAAWLLAVQAFAFAPSRLSSLSQTKGTKSAIYYEFPTHLLSDLSPEVEGARAKFWFYFFAGSGAGGIGLAQLPSMFNEAAAARESASTGSPSKGGQALNAGPLVSLYYDNQISLSDVSDVIQKAPTAEFISSNSQSVNFMASKGYIDKNDFIREMKNKGCNALATYSVFDAISSGKGGIVSPVVYDERIAKYRQGSGGGEVMASSFVTDLNAFLAVKVGAFIGLVFCLLVDFGLVAKAGIEGFLS